MRKVAAIFLVLALLTVLFAACDNDNKEETTSAPLTASSIPTTQTPATLSPVSTTKADTNNYTYVLTTSPDKTVPWGDTTAFSATTATTQPTTGIVIQIPTDNGVQTVQPSYSQATTTVPAPTTALPVPSGGTSGVDASTTTKPTTTKPTTTKPVVKKAVSVDVGSSAFNGDTTLIVDIDGSNWSSQFVANTVYLPAVIDGSGTGKNVKCTLSSTPDAANNYTISVDVSDLSLSPNAVLSISFPEGFIQTKAGTQYSNAFEVNSTY